MEEIDRPLREEIAATPITRKPATSLEVSNRRRSYAKVWLTTGDLPRR